MILNIPNYSRSIRTCTDCLLICFVYSYLINSCSMLF